MWIDLSTFPHRRAGLAKTCGENIQANTSGRHFQSFADFNIPCSCWFEVSSLCAIRGETAGLKEVCALQVTK